MIIEETTEVEKDQGFTLVELLIVIVILGILATIVVFAVRGITDQGQASSCKATAKTYEVAIEAYYARYGNAVNPTGDQLQAANLIRSYNGTHVQVTAGAPFSSVSVNTAATSDCKSVIL
jgi:prepilin-type N-terminal cleavage/methylation domain-containing protein